MFFKFQIRLSLNPLRDGPALLSGKKLPLKTVITFFELDKVSVRRPEMYLSLLLLSSLMCTLHWLRHLMTPLIKIWPLKMPPLAYCL